MKHKLTLKRQTIRVLSTVALRLAAAGAIAYTQDWSPGCVFRYTNTCPGTQSGTASGTCSSTFD